MSLIRWTAIAVVCLAVGCGGDPDDNSGNTDAKQCVPPVGFTFSAIGTKSFASFGWTGAIHNVAVTDGTPFGVKVKQCDGCDGVCSFDGPTPPVSPVNRLRCLNRSSKVCTQDSECPNDGTPYRKCVFIYDAPVGNPLVGSGGKIGACGWSYIPIAAAGQPPSIVGTIDQTSGEVNLQSLIVNLPFNGTGGTYRGSCAECIGDPIANDGIKGGTCMPTLKGQQSDPSLDIGMPCDIHRFGNIPGFEGNYSLDCSPTVRTTDGPPNVFGGVFNSGGYQISITEQSPNCTDPAFAGQKCFCGACPDGLTSCLSNADCGGATCGFLPTGCNPNPPPYRADGSVNPDFNPMFAPHQCRTTGTPDAGDAAQKQVTVGGNTCIDGMCNWNAELGLGSCISKLNMQRVGCYPTGIGASVIAPGRATRTGGVFIVDTATALCNRITPSPAVNGQIGLPGLTFQKRSFRISPEYPQ